jgi:transcriptional regulator with XRE-family HTH domain
VFRAAQFEVSVGQRAAFIWAGGMSAQANIRTRRKALGVKQSDLAARAKTNVCALSYIERGILNHHYSAATRRRVERTLARIERNARYRQKSRVEGNAAAISGEARH